VHLGIAASYLVVVAAWLPTPPLRALAYMGHERKEWGTWSQTEGGVQLDGTVNGQNALAYHMVNHTYTFFI